MFLFGLDLYHFIYLMQKNKQTSILLIDNQKNLKKDLTDILGEKYDVKIYSALSEDKVEKYLSTKNISLIISETKLKDFSGFDALKLKNKLSPTSIFIFYSIDKNPKSIIKAFKNKADDYIIKPNLKSLVKSISSNIKVKLKAIKQNKVELEAQSKLKRLQLLNDLNIELQKYLDIKEIVQHSYRIIPKFLNVDKISVFLYSPELDGLISEKYIGEVLNKDTTLFQPLSVGISGKCYREEKTIVIDNCDDTDIIPKRFVEQLSLKSCIAVPLKALGECIGVIRLDYIRSFHHFTKEEIEFYELLGLQLGAIIRNSQLYSEQKKITEALKESNERYFLTIEATEQGIWDWNVLTNEVFFSPQWKKQIGYEDHELKNAFETWVNLLHPYDKEKSIQIVRNYLEHPQKHYISEFRLRHKDGSYRWIFSKASSIIDENGKVVRMFGSHTDITEQKLFELKILESEKQFRTLFEKAADAIFIADMNEGIILDVNEAACSLLKKSKEQIIGIHQSQLHPEEIKEEVKSIFKEHIRETIESNISRPIESEVVCSNGEVVPVEIIASMIYFKGKHCLMGFFRNITERKKVEKELAHSYELMKYTIEHTQSSIAVHDEKMNFIYVSQRYYKDFKLKEKNIVSKNHYEVFPSLPEYVKEVHQRALNGESVSAQNSILSFSDGSIEYANWLCIPWYKSDNSIGGIITYIEFITERVKAELELKQSEKRLRTFLETSIEGVVAVDINENITYVNPRFAELLGYQVDELLNKNFQELLFPEDIHLFLEQKRIRKKGKSAVFELKLKTKTNQKVWFLISASPLLDDNGNYIGSFGMLTDITEKKNIEDKIKRSEQRFRSIWENSFDAMRLTNAEGIIIEVNEAFCKLFNKNREEIIGQPFYFLYSDYLEDNASEKYKTIFIEGIIEPSQETKINLWYGEQKWVSITNSFIYDESGEKLLLSIFRDISERKTAEEEIRKLYRGIEHSTASVMITNKEGVIEYVNPRFCEVSGYTLDEIIGEKPSILKSGLTDSDIYEELWNTISSGHVWKGEFLNKKKNGELFWESALISPIFNENGEITHYIGIKEDITEKKKLFEELVQAKEKAEESNRLKSSFLANMSHELRTPLNGILGYAEIIRDDSNELEIKEHASIIFKSGKRLLETLNFILDYSKIESEKVEAKFDNANIVSLLNEIVKLHLPNAIKKNIELNFNAQFKDFYIKTDIKLFNSIFNNLINNAIKFTEKGSVSIKLEKSNKQPPNFISIIVEDTGIGISKEKQSIIWEPFRQLSEGKSRSYEGTGLGLTIVKKYVELLNGHIELESQVGKGSKFTIHFPTI